MNIEKGFRSEWKSGERRGIGVCVDTSWLIAACAVSLSWQRSRSWCGAVGNRELPAPQCPTLPLALASCELLMSIRRKDGSWNSFTRQSYHNGGWVQLQPNAGVHSLQHQPEPLPASTRAYVSIPDLPACCVYLLCAWVRGLLLNEGAENWEIWLGSHGSSSAKGFIRFLSRCARAPSPPGGGSVPPPGTRPMFSSLSLHWPRFNSPQGPIALRFKLLSPREIGLIGTNCLPHQWILCPPGCEWNMECGTGSTRNANPLFKQQSWHEPAKPWEMGSWRFLLSPCYSWIL